MAAELASLLRPVMHGGELLRPHPPLGEVRRRCAAELAALRPGQLRLREHTEYPVRPSHALRLRQRAVLRAVVPSSDLPSNKRPAVRTSP